MCDLEESSPAAPPALVPTRTHVPRRIPPSTLKKINICSMAHICYPDQEKMDSEKNEVLLNTSSESENRRQFPTFQNCECGEPLRPQHLRIDFTPSEVDENEETQMKCLDFFKYLQSRPDIQKLMATPVFEDCEVSEPSSIEKIGENSKEEVKTEQAVYWIKALVLRIQGKHRNNNSGKYFLG